MTKKLSEMNEDERKALLKKLWSRCYMRLKNQLQKKPEKREIESCIAHEIYLIKHNLVEEKRGRPRHEEEFLDIVTKRAEEINDKNEVILELKKQTDKEFREETRGVDLRFWKDEDEVTHEQESKKLERSLNAELEKRSWAGICPRCRSSVCRCSSPSSEEDE